MRQSSAIDEVNCFVIFDEQMHDEESIGREEDRFRHIPGGKEGRRLWQWLDQKVEEGKALGWSGEYL